MGFKIKDDEAFRSLEKSFFFLKCIDDFKRVDLENIQTIDDAWSKIESYYAYFFETPLDKESQERFKIHAIMALFPEESVKRIIASEFYKRDFYKQDDPKIESVTSTAIEFVQVLFMIERHYHDFTEVLRWLKYWNENFSSMKVSDELESKIIQVTLSAIAMGIFVFPEANRENDAVNEEVLLVTDRIYRKLINLEF